MRLVDNNILQALGSARLLDLLRHYPDLVTSPRVAAEQERTAPPHSREAFRKAVAEKWIRVQPPPGEVSPSSVFARLVDRFGVTDAQLVAWAAATGATLFTDETALIAAAEANACPAYDLAEILDELRRASILAQSHVERVVAAIEFEDGRIFTPADRELLGLSKR